MKKVLFLLIVSALTIAGCKNKSNTESTVDEFAEYLSFYPDKVVSSTASLKYILNKKVATDVVDNSVFTIKPAIKGEVQLNGNELQFVPSEKLENGKQYTVTLHLAKLYPNIQSGLEDFTTKITTKKLQFNVALLSPMMYDKDWYYVEGSFNASDVIETEKITDILKANYSGRDIPINFDINDDLSAKVYFKIDSIKRQVDDKVLKVSWNGKAIGTENKGNEEINIYGKNTFKVLDVNVTDKEKNHIEITFSDPIEKKQNLSGLIQFVNSSNRFSYKIKNNKVAIYPNVAIFDKIDIEIFKEIKNTEGYHLKNNYIQTLYFEQLNPSVSFIKSGTILPNADNLKINFKAANLRAVDVTVYKIYQNNVLQYLQQNNLNNKGDIRYVGRPEAKYTVNLNDYGLKIANENAYAVDLAELITVENGAMYRVELDFKQAYSNYACDGKVATETIVFGKKEVNDSEYNKTNSYGYYYDDEYYEDYNWRDREDPCKSSYYYNKSIKTNVLGSDLGLIIKKGTNNSVFATVTNLLKAEPEAGAKVTLYNLQQQELASAQTNEEGVTTFDNVENAFFAVATKGKSTTYLKVNDANALSMSKFDIAGAKLTKGINGYIYGERGVWRPGDQLFLTFVLNDIANPIPERHPIKFELINPQGKIIDRTIKHKVAHNVYSYRPKTNADDITGKWKLRVSVGGAVFYKGLKIETIKPNRLKIKIKTDEKIITANDRIKGDVEVKWLHGAIARNLKIDINAKYSQTTTTFDGYSQYTFDDITRKFSTEEFSIYNGTLSNEGTTSFSALPELASKAPGMLKANFITKVYENGGDFSSDVYSTKVSPYTSYVGLLSAEEQQSKNYLFTDENYTFNLVNLNEKGKPVANNNLDIKVYKLSWRWWWTSSEDGLSRYDGSTHHNSFEEFDASTNAQGKATFDLKVDRNDWGRFLIKVTDKKSKHSTSKIVYYDWPSWYGKKRGSQDKSNATMLVFTTDKESYKVNETATVKFPSSANARALVTIENGTEVLDHFWVDTEDKQTSFSFPVLASYTPNVYVNISLLQEHSQTVNDLPIRMYGSIPMQVYDPATKLDPVIGIADELKPETTTTISVSEKEGKSMTYTIAIVDDGLLDLTRFKTPNPWHSFYARQSLGVTSWDMFDDVIGAFGGKVQQILSIGGDESEAGSKNKKANRFKPMVRFLGPFTLKSGATDKHDITIPKYVGSVRAMVVASNTKESAYGKTDKTVFVRKPVMVLASLPRKITPKETVTLPVTVFAMKKSVKNVNIKVSTNEGLSIEGSATQQLSFSQPDEKMAYFKLNVNDFIGIGKVKIEATSGSEKATYEVEIDVLNPNPVTFEDEAFVLKAKESKTIAFESFGTDGTNFATIEVSSVPPINFNKRLAYLIKYPHGCIEQTTSSAFPQLYFPELFDLHKDKQEKIQRNIKATIQRLSNFQISNGGLAYWPGNSRADFWGTSYAGHFLLEAAKKGYTLPIGFKSKWINFQKQAARNWRYNDSYYNNGLTQAYRLYTLSLAGSPDLASMNRLRETQGISNRAKMRLALAYALIGKQSIAKTIISNLSGEDTTKRYYNYGSVTRDKAMALETYLALNDTQNAMRIAKEVAKNLSSETWMSTQTTAYSLLAMAKFAMQNKAGDGIKASYTLNKNTIDLNSNGAFVTTEKQNLNKTNNFNITNNGNGVVYVSLLKEGVLPVGEEKLIQKNLDITINYKDKNGNSLAVDELSQGTNFIAEIKLKNTTATTIENIALTQYLPSGWEIINTRFTDYGANTENDQVDYTDIRDDRVSNYFTLKKHQTKTFSVLLNASYLGRYYLPGVQAEAMYNNDFIARTQGKWINVIK